ncbi:MAG: Npun_R2479 family HD domain-containing metalloprotein [Cyanobacteria bacterium P01_A01_bin.123]
MINTNELLIDIFVDKLRAGYAATYGGLKANYADIIAWVGNMALENIASSNALYHNTEHTVLVTLVGQEILRGRHIREGGVSSEDWLHFLISLCCHAIGYVKGVCHQDYVFNRVYATGRGEETVVLPLGSTDASLAPYHVDRGKLFIKERFGGHGLIKASLIQDNIELTRFPVPYDSNYQDTLTFPGLVRAANLIGQLSDPRYLQKIPTLFYEFEETGVNQQLGYENPEDLRLNYPRFYWKTVYPYIEDAISYLQLTQEGKQILANLYAHVFEVEHEAYRQPL